jgi:hypothetical protein
MIVEMAKGNDEPRIQGNYLNINGSKGNSKTTISPNEVHSTWKDQSQVVHLLWNLMGLLSLEL